MQDRRRFAFHTQVPIVTSCSASRNRCGPGEGPEGWKGPNQAQAQRGRAMVLCNEHSQAVLQNVTAPAGSDATLDPLDGLC